MDQLATPFESEVSTAPLVAPYGITIFEFIEKVVPDKVTDSPSSYIEDVDDNI